MGSQIPSLLSPALSTSAVFQSRPLAMVPLLLALLPVLAPTSQATPLSSDPNPSDFGIRQQDVFTPRRAKRSIIPLIEGAANYWLRCLFSCFGKSVFHSFRLAEINATPGRLVWVQINGVSSKREGKTRKKEPTKEPLTVFVATETPTAPTTTTAPKTVTTAKSTKPPSQTTILPHTVHIIEPLLPPAPVLPVLPLLNPVQPQSVPIHPIPPQLIAIHPTPPQSMPIHATPPQSIPIHVTPPQSPGTAHPVHETTTFLRLPRRAVYPGGLGEIFYKNERFSTVVEVSFFVIICNSFFFFPSDPSMII